GLAAVSRLNPDCSVAGAELSADLRRVLAERGDRPVVPGLAGAVARRRRIADLAARYPHVDALEMRVGRERCRVVDAGEGDVGLGELCRHLIDAHRAE